MSQPIPSGNRPKVEILTVNMQGGGVVYDVKISDLTAEQKQVVQELISKRGDHFRKVGAQYKKDNEVVYRFFEKNLGENAYRAIQEQFCKKVQRLPEQESSSERQDDASISSEDATPEDQLAAARPALPASAAAGDWVEVDSNEKELLSLYHALVRSIEAFKIDDVKASEKEWRQAKELAGKVGAPLASAQTRWNACLKDGGTSIRRRIELLGLLIPHLEPLDLSTIGDLQQVKEMITRQYATRKPSPLEKFTDRLTPTLGALTALERLQKLPSDEQAIRAEARQFDRNFQSNRVLHQKLLTEVYNETSSKENLAIELPRRKGITVDYVGDSGEEFLRIRPQEMPIAEVKTLVEQQGGLGREHQLAIATLTPSIFQDTIPSAAYLTSAFVHENVGCRVQKEEKFTILRRDDSTIVVQVKVKLKIDQLQDRESQLPDLPGFQIEVNTFCNYTIKIQEGTVSAVEIQGAGTTWKWPDMQDLPKPWKKKLRDVVVQINCYYQRDLVPHQASLRNDPFPSIVIPCNSENKETLKRYLSSQVKILTDGEFFKYQDLRNLYQDLMLSISNEPDITTWTRIQNAVRAWATLIPASDERNINRCLKDGQHDVRRRFELLGLFLPHLIPYLEREDSVLTQDIEQTKRDLRAHYKSALTGPNRLDPIIKQLEQLQTARAARKDLQDIIARMEEDASSITLSCATQEALRKLVDILGVNTKHSPPEPRA